MNQLYTPAVLGGPRARASNPTPGYRPEAVLTLEGLAQDATSAGLRRRARRALQYMRVGSAARGLSHELEPGWPIALRLREGVVYRCEAFECELPENTPTSALPSDETTPDGIVFHNVARALGTRKDTADERRRVHDAIGVWTDGLMLLATAATGELVAGRVYRVEVRALPTN